MTRLIKTKKDATKKLTFNCQDKLQHFPVPI